MLVGDSKHMKQWLAGLAGLVCLFTLAACGSKQKPSPQADAIPHADPNAVVVGEPNATGPFTVTLAVAESPIKPGAVPFTASVFHQGKPVSDANVTVTLSMPKMGMPGPAGHLTWDAKKKQYAGKVQAGMAGEWQADVTVDAAGQSGRAAWTFDVDDGK